MILKKTAKLLKVGVMKEIMRLLALDPSNEHERLILREWNRKGAHRDVKVQPTHMSTHMSVHMSFHMSVHTHVCV